MRIAQIINVKKKSLHRFNTIIKYFHNLENATTSQFTQIRTEENIKRGTRKLEVRTLVILYISLLNWHIFYVKCNMWIISLEFE